MENGCGKMESFSPQALEMIRSLGTTHIWYIGMLEQAKQELEDLRNQLQSISQDIFTAGGGA